MKFIKSNWILLVILIAGLFFRIYKPLSLFAYGHDQDLAGWMIKDILVNHHIRLIGQETSSSGVFIGPLFYYLQIPFYLLTGMQPTGTIILVTILGVFTIFSFYYCFSKIWNKNVGLVASLFYAFSELIIFTDRESVPTTPVMLWMVWFFYGLWQILKGKQKYYILIGILLGLVWHFNLALALLIPLVVLVQFLSKRKIEFKFLIVGILSALVLMTPFFVFEARHGFTQTKALYESFTTQKDYVAGTAKGLPKLDRVMQLVKVNTTHIFWGSSVGFPIYLTFYTFLFLIVFLVYKKIISKELFLILILWCIFYIVFFSLNSLNTSEYYLNGMNVVWIAISSLAINYLFQDDNLKRLGIFFLLVFIFLNLFEFFNRAPNRNGYIERKALVAFIKEDASKHNYPCVSVSYITSPGNELGYRYLYWLEDMHVNQPISQSPVYTIVFPHSKVDRIDKSFGALGLIYPEYNKYNKADVDKSCSGQNANLTDPMFGYTE